MPFELRYLWGWFNELSLGLEAGGFGPAVVSWQSLTAWCDLMDMQIEPREALLLVRLGQVRAVVSGESKAKPGAKGS